MYKRLSSIMLLLALVTFAFALVIGPLQYHKKPLVGAYRKFNSVNKASDNLIQSISNLERELDSLPADSEMKKALSLGLPELKKSLSGSTTYFSGLGGNPELQAAHHKYIRGVIIAIISAVAAVIFLALSLLFQSKSVVAAPMKNAGSISGDGIR